MRLHRIHNAHQPAAPITTTPHPTEVPPRGGISHSTDRPPPFPGPPPTSIRGSTTVARWSTGAAAHWRPVAAWSDRPSRRPPSDHWRTNESHPERLEQHAAGLPRQPGTRDAAGFARASCAAASICISADSAPNCRVLARRTTVGGGTSGQILAWSAPARPRDSRSSCLRRRWRCCSVSPDGAGRQRCAGVLVLDVNVLVRDSARRGT
jgi:hypothetical protein